MAGNNGGTPWKQMILSFLIPLVGLAFCQAANDRAPEQAPYIRAATLAGFALYAAVLAVRLLL